MPAYRWRLTGIDDATWTGFMVNPIVPSGTFYMSPSNEDLKENLYALLASVCFSYNMGWGYVVRREVCKEYAVILTPRIPNSIFAQCSRPFTQKAQSLSKNTKGRLQIVSSWSGASLCGPSCALSSLRATI